MDMLGPLMFITLLAVFIFINVATKNSGCYFDRRCNRERRLVNTHNLELDRRTKKERRTIIDRRKLLQY